MKRIYKTDERERERDRGEEKWFGFGLFYASTENVR